MGTNANNYLLGISLKWKVFNGYKNLAEIQVQKSKHEQLRLEYQNKKSKAELEITSVEKQFEVAIKKTRLAAKKMLSRSNQIQKLKSDRYKEGLVKTADLLEAEASLAKHEVNRLNALHQVLLASYHLNFLKQQGLNQ